MAEIVVVGAGLIGMMCARALAREGAQVVLVERGQAGREASWAGGGILSPLYPWRYPDAVSELAAWGQQQYPRLLDQLREESGVDPQYRASGLLVLDGEEVELAQTWAARWQAELQTVDGDTLQALEPALRSPVAQALWLPAVGQVRNPRLTRALRGAVLQAGVALREQCPVQGFWIESGRVRGVDTPQGRIPAQQVVVAGGAWTADLLASTGLQLPVEPVRGQMLLFKAIPELVQRISLYQGRYLIPRQDGRVVVGSTLERVGFQKDTTDTAHHDLRQAALDLVPELAAYPVEHHWAGLRPGSPSGVPLVGPHPHCEGLFINVGHFRNGVILGPASVQLLVDQVCKRPSFTDPAPYQAGVAMGSMGPGPADPAQAAP